MLVQARYSLVEVGFTTLLSALWGYFVLGTGVTLVAALLPWSKPPRRVDGQAVASSPEAQEVDSTPQGSP
jgi:hypothetical protein